MKRLETVDRFDGWIAGLGTEAGLRVVVGRWASSPLGGFTDVMLEQPDGHRILLAPGDVVATYVAATYRFDDVMITGVRAEVRSNSWLVTAGPLRMELEIGHRPALGWLLRAVPRALATAPAWIQLTDAVAQQALPGVRTRGSAGGGREEFYAALDLHRIVVASVRWRGADQGSLVPVTPPVRFGFGSTPATPSLVRVVSLVARP
ncbi:MAG: hypothetical protein JO100_15580 [Pseudonocardia sp.]|nr:hypothetical protein [Pseudonocardia sp.]